MDLHLLLQQRSLLVLIPRKRDLQTLHKNNCLTLGLPLPAPLDARLVARAPRRCQETNALYSTIVGYCIRSSGRPQDRNFSFFVEAPHKGKGMMAPNK